MYIINTTKSIPLKSKEIEEFEENLKVLDASVLTSESPESTYLYNYDYLDVEIENVVSNIEMALPFIIAAINTVKYKWDCPYQNIKQHINVCDCDIDIHINQYGGEIKVQIHDMNDCQVPSARFIDCTISY